MTTDERSGSVELMTGFEVEVWSSSCESSTETAVLLIDWEIVARRERNVIFSPQTMCPGTEETGTIENRPSGKQWKNRR
jgi:hypothetical protein